AQRYTAACRSTLFPYTTLFRSNRARDLGEELGSGHADGDRQADAVEHLTTQSDGDLGRGAGHPPKPADIEERLVDRQALDPRRRSEEHTSELQSRVDLVCRLLL